MLEKLQTIRTAAQLLSVREPALAELLLAACATDWGEGHIMSIRHRDPRALQPNMTFHNIPWVKIPGKGGIGLSETIRVTEDGCEVSTQLPRQLYIK